MEESQLGIQIVKGIKGAMQDFLAPDIRTIINELKHHSKLMDEHGQKLDKLSDAIYGLDAKMDKVLMQFDLERRIRNLEEATRSLPTMLENQKESREDISRLMKKIEARNL